MNSMNTDAMILEGRSLRVRWIEPGLAELSFDREDESTNKLDRQTVAELNEAVRCLARLPGLRGVLCSSAKEVFVVGADLNEFATRFDMTQDDVARDTRGAGDAFTALEDLPVPSVAAINGYALGGGMELALACSLRVMSSAAQVGLPEVKLGLIPGAGGNVRLPRVIGTQLALQWITGGKSFDAQAALAAHAVDDICAPLDLRDSALRLLRQAAGGGLDWQQRRQAKCSPIAGKAGDRKALYAQAREGLASRPQQRTAAIAAIGLMERCDALPRDAARQEELQTFAQVVKTPEAAQLVRAFLEEQRARKMARAARAAS